MLLVVTMGAVAVSDDNVGAVAVSIDAVLLL